MLLSIVILSYNRPLQLERILCKFENIENGRFNIIIKDDVSPLINEIEQVYKKYRDKLAVEVRLYNNELNLGYDKNLISSFDITESEYVFLLSDDDYIEGREMERLISVLSKREEKFYFTPYTDKLSGVINRVFSESIDHNETLIDFSSVIYNSILFSGLIYHRKTVLGLNLDRAFLSNCIYTQVYLAAIIIYNTKSFGVVPSGVLFLGGDGDSFFGKNESAKNSELLTDRNKLTSNLNYQPFLLSVVDKIASMTNPDIRRLFLKEYKKRLISYGLRARSHGLKSYLVFLKAYMKSNIPFFIIPFSFYMTFFLIAAKWAKKINDFGIKKSRHSG